MDTNKLDAIVKLMESNPEAKEALTGLTSVPEAVAVLNRYGVAITEEEFVGYVKLMHSEELPEEVLEYVSGGGWRQWLQGFFDGFYDSTIGLFNKR